MHRTVADFKVVDGLPLRRGVKVAVDTIVCASHPDDTPRRDAGTKDGVALWAAQSRKERTYPGLGGPRQRAQLVVVAVKVGGHWSEKTREGFVERTGYCPIAR